jgi:hypothetical protein
MKWARNNIGRWNCQNGSQHTSVCIRPAYSHVVIPAPFSLNRPSFNPALRFSPSHETKTFRIATPSSQCTATLSPYIPIHFLLLPPMTLRTRVPVHTSFLFFFYLFNQTAQRGQNIRRGSGTQAHTPIVIHIAHAKNQRVEGGQERNGQGHDPSVSQRRLTCRKIQIQNNKREFVNGGVETQTTTGKQPRAQHLVPGSDIGLVAMFVY